MFKWEGHSEVDKYALSVYEKHFPESEALGDITAIRNTRGLPEKLDLVTFGFPCQDLSVAGKRGGITASRSGLFTKAMRIIRAKRPSYIIFENVKGLFSSNEGRDFAFVLRTLARAGYDGQWQLLNTRWFLPQNRERVYFVGHLRGKPRPEVFPIGERDTGINKKKETGIIVERAPIKFPGRNQRKIEGDYAFTIDSMNTGGIRIKEATKKGYAVAEEGDSINLAIPNSKTRRGRVGKGEAQTLDTGMQQYTIQNGIRCFTPIECERLQGFPVNWTKYNKKGKKGRNVSDSQRYKMMGNAVSVPVVKEVISRLIESGAVIENYLDLFSGAGGFRLGIEEAINEFSKD